MMEPQAELINPAPVVHRRRATTRSAAFQKSRQEAEVDEHSRDPFDAEVGAVLVECSCDP
jgi:hypothetical protein